MIQMLFRECCEECPHIKVDYETSEMGMTVIGCEHMKVCGHYHREDPPPQDITVKGFCDADG